MRTIDVEPDYIARCLADAEDEQRTLDTTPELRALAERYRRERGKAYQAAMRERQR